MELSHNEARVLGAVIESGGKLRPSELRARYDFSKPLRPDTHPDLREKTSAILNIDEGIRGLEERGLIEWRQDPNAIKTYQLTELGERLTAN